MYFMLVYAVFAELCNNQQYSSKVYCICTFSCRDVVKEDRIQNSKSMDRKYLKSCSSEGKLPDELSKSLIDEVGIGLRSYSCSNKAFTFSAEKIRDVSLHGVRVRLNVDMTA